MQITAAMVKELRELTGAGMMECKKALTECDGNLENAIEMMRKAGTAKAAKKSGRIAAEGQIKIAISDCGKKAAIVEVNAETDFATKSDDFVSFADKVTQCVLAYEPADIDALNEFPLEDGGETVLLSRDHLVAKIGENINVRRFRVLSTDGQLGSYSHGDRIGAVVELDGGDENLARDIAMHIAATRPVSISENEVPAELLEKEKGIFMAQAAESGKPPEIIEKMITGRMKKFVAEITLTGQPFVKDPDQTVAELLAAAKSNVSSFTCYEVGEGIEKKQEDFAAEVEAQAQAAKKA
ncbi:MAG: translation elongation factor Ts [Gammaproteobacteria bacterium]